MADSARHLALLDNDVEFAMEDMEEFSDECSDLSHRPVQDKDRQGRPVRRVLAAVGFVFCVSALATLLWKGGLSVIPKTLTAGGTFDSLLRAKEQRDGSSASSDGASLNEESNGPSAANNTLAESTTTATAITTLASTTVDPTQPTDPDELVARPTTGAGITESFSSFPVQTTPPTELPTDNTLAPLGAVTSTATAVASRPIDSPLVITDALPPPENVPTHLTISTSSAQLSVTTSVPSATAVISSSITTSTATSISSSDGSGSSSGVNAGEATGLLALNSQATDASLSAARANEALMAAQFSKARAHFLAAMMKISYCGTTPGLASAAMATCRTYGRSAGITCLSGTLRPVSVADDGVEGAIFAYVLAYLEQGNLDRRFLVIIRATTSGPQGAQNAVRNRQAELVPYFNDTCPGAMAHAGYTAVWDRLRDPLFAALQASNAVPGSTLMVAGFSLGGATSQLAMYDLARRGFRVAQTCVIGSPRVLNEPLVECLRGFLGRPVPYFVITNQRDFHVNVPSRPGYADMPFEVHITNDQVDLQFCGGQVATCGRRQYPPNELSGALFHCPNPLAPEANLCFRNNNIVQVCGLGVGL